MANLLVAATAYAQVWEVQGNAYWSAAIDTETQLEQVIRLHISESNHKLPSLTISKINLPSTDCAVELPTIVMLCMAIFEINQNMTIHGNPDLNDRSYLLTNIAEASGGSRLLRDACTVTSEAIPTHSRACRLPAFLISTLSVTC